MSSPGPYPSDFTLQATNKRQRESNELRAQKRDLEARLATQEKLMGKFRSAIDVEAGGLVGKWMHLANLNADTLTGQTLAQIFFALASLFLQKEYQTDVAIYKAAQKQGIGYVNQTIYRCNADGTPNFNEKYRDGEEISRVDIYQNGYIPPADVRSSLGKELGQTIQGAMGVKAMGRDLLIRMFGANKANEILKDKPAADKGRDLVSDNAAMRGTRPAKIPT